MKKAKKPRRVEEKTVFVLLLEGRAALRKRPDSGLLAGLWEFPNTDGVLDEDAAAEVLRSWGLEPKSWRKRLTAKHLFTHVEWRMTGYVLEVSGNADFFWTPSLDACAVPSAFAKFSKEALALLGGAP